ncbi:Adenylate kinase [Paenibacillus sophorae]|uniref:Adenylate kinase n=1 Tax=Paenibacillus sophorae TaxID=1333845 RepID=A0A1H8Q0M3_9BACL|nr:DNA topology modulation protein [Paenibacillus sophorae]QWU15316.1 DNA topology modulation protein [Paenibacillus sophorae]SEO47730.1 Adenylate kinase [Paenibacillus sophorae]
MNRVLVIGSSGAGKSTLSQKLSKILNIPVIHLDAYFWNANWVSKPNDEWDKIVEKFTNEDQWIIDGNYSRTMDIRIKKADLIIFLDMPRLLCIYRIIKRRIRYHKKTRPDMNEGCPEKLDWEFIKWVWNYRKRSRMNTITKLEYIRENQQVIIAKTRRQVDELIEKLEKLRNI